MRSKLYFLLGAHFACFSGAPELGIRDLVAGCAQPISALIVTCASPIENTFERAETASLKWYQTTREEIYHSTGWLPSRKFIDRSNLASLLLNVFVGAPITVGACGLPLGMWPLSILVQTGAAFWGFHIAEMDDRIREVARNALINQDSRLFESCVSCMGDLDIDCYREAGHRSLLHFAISSSNVKGVEFLLDGGADPNIKDRHGNTSLHRAVRDPFVSNRLEICKLLVANKARADEPNAAGITPRQIAHERGLNDIAALFVLPE